MKKRKAKKPKKTKRSKVVSTYVSMTDEAVQTLALRIFKHEVFTSDHVADHDQNLLQSIFLCLPFMDKETIKEMQTNNIQMLWAEMSSALSRSINGYPIFTSMGMADESDRKRIWEKYERIKKLIEPEKPVVQKEAK